MDSEFDCYPLPFGVDDLIQKGRNGSYPDGYLDQYLAYLRRSHAAAQAEIEQAGADAKAGPEQNARLTDARSAMAKSLAPGNTGRGARAAAPAAKPAPKGRGVKPATPPAGE
jgi:hypothetical protein